jgi:hypothetical protein
MTVPNKICVEFVTMSSVTGSTIVVDSVDGGGQSEDVQWPQFVGGPLSAAHD